MRGADAHYLTGPVRPDPVTVQKDVIYSRTNGSAVLADIAYPVGGVGLPAILYVHGGRWRAGSATTPVRWMSRSGRVWATSP